MVPAARAADVRVNVVDRVPAGGAHGLLVPGAGAKVSRAGALAALERGKVRNSLLGGVPAGKPLIRVSATPGETTVYVTLPPPGTHPNDRRYPVAIVGPAYRAGILFSANTRIPGLVSIADVAPTVLALRRGERPPVRARAGTLGKLDGRLTRVRHLRVPVRIAIVAVFLLLIALRRRSAPFAGAAALAVLLALSALGVDRLWLVLALLVPIAIAGSVVAERLFPLLLLIYLVVLVAWPEVSALAAIGTRPDGGGRFYGISNDVETLLLAPVLAAASVPVAMLALVTVAWSRAGADGGGMLVYAAGFAVLALRRRGLRLTPRTAAAVAAAIVVLGLALVGLDAATGGSSHVTRALGAGPGSLAGDLGHRLHQAWAGATVAWWRELFVVIGLGALAWLATRRPRLPVLDAFLVAVAVSLVVNDTPQDVALFGGLGGLALYASRKPV